MKKYKITKEIAELYAKVMEMKEEVKEEWVTEGCKARVISVKAILGYMESFSHLAEEGCLISREQKEDFRGSAYTLYQNLRAAWDSDAETLDGRLKALRPEPEPEPEPEPSFSEVANKEFEAAKVLLGGSEGVVFVVSPKEVRRFFLNEDCRIAKQSHHLHAIIEALAKSMGLITEEGEQSNEG